MRHKYAIMAAILAQATRKRGAVIVIQDTEDMRLTEALGRLSGKSDAITDEILGDIKKVPIVPEPRIPPVISFKAVDASYQAERRRELDFRKEQDKLRRKYHNRKR